MYAYFSTHAVLVSVHNPAARGMYRPSKDDAQKTCEKKVKVMVKGVKVAI